MSNYAGKLSSIEDKMKKLKEEENKLIEKRKTEIGSLAEKFNLLMLSDELIVGIFSEAKDVMSNNNQKLKSWEENGKELLKPKRNNKKLKESTN